MDSVVHWLQIESLDTEKDLPDIKEKEYDNLEEEFEYPVKRSQSLCSLIILVALAPMAGNM